MLWQKIIEASNAIYEKYRHEKVGYLVIDSPAMMKFAKLMGAGCTYPTPGEDAQWIAYCENCAKLTNHTDDYTLHVSVGGFKSGGIDHCYSCGHEKPLWNIKEDDRERMVTSCRFHWKKFPAAPYNWHQLTESEKFKLLGINND